MRIHYDWRLARVVDDEGNIVDELEEGGSFLLLVDIFMKSSFICEVSAKTMNNL